ncbi:accessory Sec system glycosylation chaperone GtfB [Streptococcus loxodontisalivarius]|uniref:UDP-N-acetylglucosamine--peptide N-acetylglucosaminyltransferase stabilizing protein GtfB n=1 Tax=Streptococcus loxodontisalivarius TaxID=1349415 RepID=A0ABS2PU45_9STRE|nr:accessory Sec system glycosylation chaperone GtfB [Streptococcus loxodontisalivarius]MBM7643451.1 accessory Sec system glycosyltransferase GtfB [Streptococcus loxodontisalivarius]
MINLFDEYTQTSWDLHYSLIMSGYNNPTISIADDGFLPDDVTSPYLYFTGFAEETGHPLYFNDVKVPDYWEIRASNNNGEIFDYRQKRGHIHYAKPSHNRLVKAVDWYDQSGRTRLTDRYNKFGYRFAQTSYNLSNQAVMTTYFDKNGFEVLVENHVTGTIVLNQEEQVLIFKSRVDFVIHYLKVAGFNLDRIFYNSLSTPFLVAYYLNQPGSDLLFWHEEIGDSIPQNMVTAFSNLNRPTGIVAQNPLVYQKMLGLMTPEQQMKVNFLGYIYPFKRDNIGRKEALVLTNSDQLQGFEEFVTSNPEITFHVGAITEMSPKLMAFGQYANVALYPNITTARVQELYQTCDIYLDINHGSEILSAVRTAFENNMIILSFDKTCHHKELTSPSHIFSMEQAGQMAKSLTYLQESPNHFGEYIVRQKADARVATTAEYKAVIG